MIPLLRPIDIDLFRAFEIISTQREDGVWCNFGKIHERAVQDYRGWIKKTAKIEMNPVFAVNGTAAIELAIRSFGMKNPRIAVPEFTHAGTYNAASRCGEVVACKSLEDTWQIDSNVFADDEIDIVIVVSPFGYFVDTNRFDGLAKAFNKKIVYDFAGAWGNFPATQWPLCYSFHATKNWNCGEGGAILFQDSEQAALARRLSNFDTLPDRNLASGDGYNLKIDELRAAVFLSALDQSELFQQRLSQHRLLMYKYASELRKWNPDIGRSLWSYPSLLVFGGFGAKLAEKLEKESEKHGLTVKRYYRGLSSLDSFSNVKEHWSEGCVAFPADVTEEEFAKVIAYVKLITDGNGG